VKDTTGTALASDVTWTFTTASGGGGLTCPCTVFPASAVPAIIADPDPNAVELGMKFQASVPGQITAIRFYKGATNTETHVGNLWSSTGTQLRTVTFTNETASGWQQATLPTPVAIQANTTYVVSYHTTVGRYAATGAYFGSPIVNGPLTALADGAAGGNGVYLYGAGGFEKDLAIKKVLPQLAQDTSFIEMFMDEAMITVTLNHGNIVSVMDFGTLPRSRDTARRIFDKR
jgi:serine/threonine protein kinase